MDNSIRTYSIAEIRSLMSDLGQPNFRTDQLIRWIYKEGVSSYDEMTNLPKSLRKTLSENHPLINAHVIDKQISHDGTRKYLLEYPDGALVETVAMPSEKSTSERLSVCVSSQSGCPLNCTFCATGTAEFTRNLFPGEILEQVMIVQNDMTMRASSVVVMGQGEPFLNYENSLAALELLNSPLSMKIGARHITISTCGVIPAIEKFTHIKEQYTLAVSLHSAEQAVRDALIPNMSSYKLPELKKSLQSYVTTTNRRVSLEYIMMDGINDTEMALNALLGFCNNLHCHINLLSLNETDFCPYTTSDNKTMLQWMTTLKQAGIETTIRKSRGTDIAGACGQLKNSKCFT